MKKTVRLISLLMAAVMLLGAVTFTALAEETAEPVKVYPAVYAETHTDLQYSYIHDTINSFETCTATYGERSQPLPVLLDMSEDGLEKTTRYMVQKADNPEFENAVTFEAQRVKNYVYSMYNAYLGEHFYWRAAVNIEDIEKSPVHEVYVSGDMPRNIFLYGVSNVRDIGGWPSYLGENARIREGYYIRGGELDDITVIGKKQLLELGIKAEIDLRDENQTQIMDPEDIEYHNFPLSGGSGDYTFFDEYDEEIADTFEVISHAAEKPVYLHCIAGADRTGFVSFMLLTLCGVDYEYATRDYVFTSFSIYGQRYVAKTAKWYARLGEYEGVTKAEQAASFLMSKGVTAEEIERIRQTLVENYDPAYTDPSVAANIDRTVMEEADGYGLVPYEVYWSDQSAAISRGELSEIVMLLIEKALNRHQEQILRDRGLETEDVFTDTMDPRLDNAAVLGILNGVGDGRFKPTSPATRGQLAALLSRAAECAGLDTSGYTAGFSDISGRYGWLTSEVGWAAANGILTGDADGMFRPGDTLTRKEAVAAVLEASKLIISDRPVRISSTVAETPGETSGRYITDFIPDEDIIAYLPLDGSDEQNADGTVKAVFEGNVVTAEGYFGNGADLSSGYITLEGFEPGYESFSVSLMMKCGHEEHDPLLLSNKDWDNGDTDGFALALMGGGIWLNYAQDGERKDEFFYLPYDQPDGWVNVVLIVDRENGRIGVSCDFEEPDMRDIPEELREASFAGISPVRSGQDGTGEYKRDLEGTVDEIIVFNRALTAADIESVRAYYSPDGE